MSSTNHDIRTRVFLIMRHVDVELAEVFMTRCPNIATMTELNTFFHMTLSQYAENTSELRLLLDDKVDIETWATTFRTYILPFMVNKRFPTDTRKKPISPYTR